MSPQSDHGNRKLLSGAAVAMIDQALLSAMNFGIGIAFIRLAGKTDYGIYTQLFALLLLSQSLQGAIANAPLVSLGPKRRARGRQALAAQLFRMQTVISIALAVIAFTGIEFAGHVLDMPAMTTTVAIPFALAIFGQWVREYARKYCFLRLEPHRALYTDLFYAAILAAILLYSINRDSFGTAWVFTAMAVANLLAGLFGLTITRLRPHRPHGRAAVPLAEAWRLSRWTLPGVVVTWGSNYSFVYIVALVIGVTAAAEISAARLLIMPAGLCINAWSNTFSPRFSKWVGQGEFTYLKQVMLWSAVGLAVVIAGYSTVLLLGYDLLQQYLLGEEYAGIRHLVIAWGAYFTVFAVRRIGTIAMVGGGHYKELFWHSSINFVINIPSLFLATWLLGTLGAILGLIVSELVTLLMLRYHGWPILQARWDNQSNPGS